MLFSFLRLLLGEKFSRKAKRSAIMADRFASQGFCSQTLLDGIAHEQTIICRSRGGLSANEKKEKFASNDDNNY